MTDDRRRKKHKNEMCWFPVNWTIQFRTATASQTYTDRHTTYRNRKYRQTPEVRA